MEVDFLSVNVIGDTVPGLDRSVERTFFKFSGFVCWHLQYSVCGLSGVDFG